MALFGKTKHSQLRRILCAEDDPEYREIIEMGLGADSSYRVEMHPDGESALGAITRFRPDLLIFDVRMPDMSGMEALQHIRGQGAGEKLPVIFLTAHAQPHERQKYLALGASDVIAKPFDPVSLAERVQVIWNRLRDTD